MAAYQINLVCPPQCHNVSILLEHAFQIHKHNGSQHCLYAHTHTHTLKNRHLCILVHRLLHIC